jgi:hypothetical protein
VSEAAKTAAVLAVLAAFFAGYLVGGQPRSMASEHESKAPGAVSHAHAHHGTIDISDSTAIPQVDLVIHNDSMSGRNLEIITENFRFACELRACGG